MILKQDIPQLREELLQERSRQCEESFQISIKEGLITRYEPGGKVSLRFTDRKLPQKEFVEEIKQKYIDCGWSVIENDFKVEVTQDGFDFGKEFIFF